MNRRPALEVKKELGMKKREQPAGNYTIITGKIGCEDDARAEKAVIATCGGFVEHEMRLNWSKSISGYSRLDNGTPDLGFRAVRGIDCPPGFPLPSCPTLQPTAYGSPKIQHTSHNPTCHHTLPFLA